GVAALATIADGRPAFITVQLADAYKLALARPQNIGIGYRDFSRTGEIHDDIRQVKDWLARQGFGIYAVEQMGVARNRVYYVADEETADSLLMRMLPFGEFEPLALEGLKLVANYGSYWVYEIVPPIPASDGSRTD
ncbi:MAG: hydroxylamine oxidation protein HaoB, partial [Alphaproteobacteria bacterium]|nr:hydroxylamine oxidation protein HaoB [Alphaproteobacteria bacterium]